LQKQKKNNFRVFCVTYPLYAALLPDSRWIGNPTNKSSTTVTHFTLHLLSDSRVSDSSPLAYLRKRTGELDTGTFLHCKDSKICFVGLACGIAKAGE